MSDVRTMTTSTIPTQEERSPTQIAWDDIYSESKSIDEGVETDDWRGVIESYFSAHPELTAETSVLSTPSNPLESAARRYAESGVKAIERMDDERLTGLAQSILPMSFLLSLSTEDASPDGTGPYLFPIKTILSFWNQATQLGVNAENVMQLMTQVSEIWDSMDVVFEMCREENFEPTRGENFWRTLGFEAALLQFSAPTLESKPNVNYTLICDFTVKSLFKDYETRSRYFADTEFQRMFLVSREAKGYGVPPGVSIPEELRVSLHESWLQVPEGERVSIKRMRSCVKEFRGYMDTIFSSKTIQWGPDTLSQLNDSVFHNLFVTLLQGDNSYYLEYKEIFSKQAAAVARLETEAADLSESETSLVALSTQLEVYDATLKESTLDLLDKSQDLPSYYNVFSWGESYNDLYAIADAAADRISEILKERDKATRYRKETEIVFEREVREYAATRVQTLQELGSDEMQIQEELKRMSFGVLPGLEQVISPHIREALTPRFLAELGFKPEMFATGDVFQDSLMAGNYNQAWDSLNTTVRRTFTNGMCTIHNPDGEATCEETISIFENFSSIYASDPNCQALNGYLRDVQPMIEMISILLGGGTTPEGEAMEGLADGGANRSAKTVALLKERAGSLYRRYFTACTQETESMFAVFEKIGPIFDTLKTEPTQEDLNNGYTFGIVDGFSPEVEASLRGTMELFEFLRPKKADGRSAFQNLLAMINDPSFEVYDLNRWIHRNAPALTGAVGAAVLTTLALNALFPPSAVVTGFAVVGMIVRFGVIAAMSVGGAQAGLMANDLAVSQGWAEDHGSESYAKKLYDGDMSPDDVFASLFGEVGREIWSAAGLPMRDPEKGVAKLVEQYERGGLSEYQFASLFVGEYMTQLVLMIGTAGAARVVGNMAGKMIASGRPGLVFAGEGIKRYASMIDSIGDDLASGNVTAMTGAAMRRKFVGEMTEELMEMSSNHLSSDYFAKNSNVPHVVEMFVATMNSSRVPDGLSASQVSADEDAVAQVMRLGLALQGGSNEPGQKRIVYTFSPDEVEFLKAQLAARPGSNSNMTLHADGSIEMVTEADGVRVTETFIPSSVPFTMRKLFGQIALNQKPEDILADAGVSGFDGDGQPIWNGPVSVQIIRVTLARHGFIVTEQISDTGEHQIKIDFTNDKGEVESWQWKMPETESSQSWTESCPAFMKRSVASEVAQSGHGYDVYDSDGPVIVNSTGNLQDPRVKPGDAPQYSFRRDSTAIDQDLLWQMLVKARSNPDQKFTIQIFSVDDQGQLLSSVKIEYHWSDSGLNMEKLSGASEITSQNDVPFDQSVQQLLDQERAELQSVLNTGEG